VRRTAAVSAIGYAAIRGQQPTLAARPTGRGRQGEDLGHAETHAWELEPQVGWHGDRLAATAHRAAAFSV
jgi:hypothetical protein